MFGPESVESGSAAAAGRPDALSSAVAPAQGLCRLTATDLVRLLRQREVSAVEVVQAHLERIEAVNPAVNAIVTPTAQAALHQAAEADRLTLRGGALGPLHGLPVAHKDLQDTKDVRTTYGSPIYAEHRPARDSLLVRRTRAAGAISLGKTNTPEFGTGSQTYNPVFGPTRNPHRLDLTAGGSSGGSAAALAAGMVALADGSDMAGSLRNPASFCGVVGLRPSTGRVPTTSARSDWFPLAVDGPMARTVEDVALFLSVLAGQDDSSPLSLPGDGSEFARPLDADVQGVRVGWSHTLGGLPIEPAVTEVLERCGRRAVSDLGWVLHEVEPDLNGAEESFRTWRAWWYALELGQEYDEHYELLNPDVAHNIEIGRALSAADLARAETERTRVWRSIRPLMQDVDVLLAPTVQVAPFDVEVRWVSEINGIAQKTYLDWMRSAYWITVTGLPAISIPCGRTPDGRPIGMQVIGRHLGEWRLLQIAHALETVLRHYSSE